MAQARRAAVTEPGTGRVFVSRETHVMVVDAATNNVLGDIPDTQRVHGIALAPRWNHGFTTNGGDSTVTMFDLRTLALIRKIALKVGGMDGIMYDDTLDRVILTNHSRPVGTVVAIDANTGEITGTGELGGIESDGCGERREVGLLRDLAGFFERVEFVHTQFRGLRGGFGGDVGHQPRLADDVTEKVFQIHARAP